MFTYHSKETAPVESRPFIDQSIETFGFFPNLHKILAEAPLTYEIYNTALTGIYSKSTLLPVEQEIVLMTASYENRCHYCMAGHSMLMKMKHMPEDVITALRDGLPLNDGKLETLRQFTRLLM